MTADAGVGRIAVVSQYSARRNRFAIIIQEMLHGTLAEEYSVENHEGAGALLRGIDRVKLIIIPSDEMDHFQSITDYLVEDAMEEGLGLRIVYVPSNADREAIEREVHCALPNLDRAEVS